MSRRTATAAALLTAMLTLLTACGNDKPEPTPTPTPTATTSKPATPKDQAIADATKALERYFEVADALERNPELPLDQLKTVAIGFGATDTETILRVNRGKKYKVTGETTYEINKILDVTLDNSAPEQGKVPTVTIQVCYDVSDVEVVDENGKSVVSPERLDRAIATYQVSNYTWAKNQREGWLVAGFEQPGTRSC